METREPSWMSMTSDPSFNFLASLINGNNLPELFASEWAMGSFNFLASLINGNELGHPPLDESQHF